MDSSLSSARGKEKAVARFDAAESKKQTDISSREPSQRPDKPLAGESESNNIIPLSLIKALGRRTSSVGGGSNSSSHGGSGNNSDNSALLSIGNGSFGFNFDTDEAMMNPSRAGSDGDGSDGNSPTEEPTPVKAPSEVDIRSQAKKEKDMNSMSKGSKENSGDSSATSRAKTMSSDPSKSNSSQEAAAAAAVANLHSIASSFSPRIEESDNEAKPASLRDQALASGIKRSPPGGSMGENDSGGYNTDGESASSEVPSGPGRPGANSAAPSSVTSSPVPSSFLDSDSANIETSVQSRLNKEGKRPAKKKKLDDSKREERNQREKERSFRISKQINELRNLLSNGGVMVPKGTKSSVLTEAANYIRMLQQHQYRSELDRHQLVQQMQMIGSGTLGPQAANAIRHVAAQNGVWSLGNFGGVPPKSAMTYYQGDSSGSSQSQGASNSESPLSSNIAEHDYRFVFNSCSVGMAIASMGGAFIDCNQLFCHLSNYTKQEICSMTIFNLTSREDLQPAFDLISQMISPPPDSRVANQQPKPCVLRGSMKNRNDLGLMVSLIRGDDKIAKCFCVTLIKNPTSPFDTTRPVPATTANLTLDAASNAKERPGNLGTSHAYTTG